MMRVNAYAAGSSSPIHTSGRVRCDNSTPQHTPLARLQRKAPAVRTGRVGSSSQINLHSSSSWTASAVIATLIGMNEMTLAQIAASIARIAREAVHPNRPARVEIRLPGAFCRSGESPESS